MTKKTKRTWILGALCLLVCLCITVCACGKRGQTEQTAAPSDGAAVTYTIQVKTEGGMALTGVGIYIYTDAAQQELVWFEKTNDAGEISFTDVPSDSYVAVLRDIPEGYLAEETYPITGEVTEIILSAEVAAGDLANTIYELGGVMHDFTVTAPDGTEYTLSELLEEKDAVVLNFWYIECNPCRSEFPYLQEAYENFSDSIEVLAMNPVNQDNEAIAAFQEELGLTFPVVGCDPLWANAMQLTAYPTTVIIDRYGTISMIHKGSVTETETFESMFEFYTAANYKQTVVEDLEELEDAAQLAQIGSPEEPVEIGGVTSFTVTVGPGQIAYYNIYKVNKMYMQIRSENAYIIYKGVTYKPSNGSVGLTITTADTFTPAYIQIGNDGDEAETFTVTFSVGKGTINNPYTLSLGEFSTSVAAGNDQGVYYTYVATETGYLTVECLSATAGIDYDYTLYNLNSYALRNMGADGTTNEESGNRTVTVKVTKGQTVQVIVGTLPTSSNTYPAGNFTARLSFSTGQVEEEEEVVELKVYTVTVTDENRNPISGVFLDLATETSKVTMQTDENGLSYTKQIPGTYTVTLRVPAGYKAYTTQFQLSESIPNLSVKLDTIVTETAVYTVKVVDDNGKPVPGATVRIGTSFGFTDANGTVSFTLLKGDYEAVIIAPSGYTLSNNKVVFAGGTTTAEVVAQKGNAGGSDSEGTTTPTDPADPADPADPTEPVQPDDNSAVYSVKVTDYSGNPKSGVLVLFGDNMAVTGADGVGSAVLEKGRYEVMLAFAGTQYHYESVTLTRNVTTATIKVASLRSSNVVELYVGDAYVVDVGGTYVEMQPNTINYYIFTPTEAGVYRFATSNPSAVLSYWGGNTAFISDQTSSLKDYANNAFTMNIKEGNIGMTMILGITGASDSVLEITRISDPILDDTDIVAETYTGSGDPATFSLTIPAGQKLNYLDLTAATSAYKLVKASDGRYHLNSASGPVVYVDLGTNARFISFYNMLGFTGYGGTSLTQSFYDDSGKITHREDYTELMEKYIRACKDDDGNAVYYLTDDLIYMIQQGGDFKGWWNPESGNYLFAETAGVNLEIAWMFALCYLG